MFMRGMSTRPRGAIVDEDASSTRSAKGALGPAIDVFEVEPLPPEHAVRRLDEEDSSGALPSRVRLCVDQEARRGFARGRTCCARDSRGRLRSHPPNCPPTFLFECACLTGRTTAPHPRGMLRDDIRASANVASRGPDPNRSGIPGSLQSQSLRATALGSRTGKRQFPRTTSPGANAVTRMPRACS